jgi:hypothetical protein
MITESHPSGEDQPRERLPYAAVPLDPWRAKHPNTGSSYYATSLNRISDITDRSIATAIEDGRILSVDTAQALHHFIGTSLLDAHTRRIMHNGQTNLEGISEPESVEPLTLAMDGLAHPDELYRLLRDNPQLGSVELAKLSHPFDFNASEEMDDVVRSVIASEGELHDEVPRLKVKRVDGSIPASIVVRKRVVGAQMVEGGFIEVVERRSLLVRGDEEATTEMPYVDRILKNPARRDELAELINARLKDPDPETVWLQPTTTSYYARFMQID